MTGRSEAYGSAAIAMHWATALLIVGDFAFGLYFIDLPLSPQKLRYFAWHKWAGALVLLTGAGLLAARWLRAPPSLPTSMPHWEKRLSRLTQVILYVLLFLAPLSGWLYSSAAGFQTVLFGVLPIPDIVGRDRGLAEALRALHRGINYTLAAVVAIHGLAALKHRFVDRDEVLAYMLPFLRKP
jgi:cytochrome b561